MTSSSILTIFSEHKLHIWEVLCRLCTNRLFAHADKCKFHVTSCEYLRIYLSPWRPHHGPIQSSNHPRLANSWKVKEFNPYSDLPISTVVSFTDIPKSQFHLCVLPARVHPGISLMSAILPLKHLKRLSPQLQSLPIGFLDTQITVETDASDYALTTVLSIMTPDSELHPIAFHSQTFLPRTQLWCPQQRATCNFLKLQTMVTLWRLWTSDWCGHQSPEFAILFNDQNTHTSTSTLVWISFRFQPGNPFPPGKLGTKPTHSLDDGTSILKRVIWLCQCQSTEYCLVFTSEQLALSLWATTLSIPVLHGSLIMDAERLHSDIQSQLQEDPILQNTLTNSQTPSGPSIPTVYLHHLGCIYVPNSSNLRLHVLQYSHDHPLAGHFSQMKTLHQVPYAITYWSGLPVYIKDYCKLCTTCSMPNLCATNPMDFSSNFWFPRSLGIPYLWIS